MVRITISALLCLAVVCASPGDAQTDKSKPKGNTPMRLGNFSISLAVKDLAVSKAFYEKLGFSSIGGDNKKWSIMQNETSTIGLFQGMFDKNMLTFNPGWDRKCATLPDFDDVRDIQRKLASQGLTLKTKADESTTGDAHEKSPVRVHRAFVRRGPEA